MGVGFWGDKGDKADTREWKHERSVQKKEGDGGLIKEKTSRHVSDRAQIAGNEGGSERETREGIRKPDNIHTVSDV